MSLNSKHQSETNKSFVSTTRKNLNNYDTDSVTKIKIAKM